LAVDWKNLPKAKKLTNYEQSTIFESFKTSKLNLVLEEKT
jgi:hypothetical protein